MEEFKDITLKKILKKGSMDNKEGLKKVGGKCKRSIFLGGNLGMKMEVKSGDPSQK
jgi:hypothetical protein